MVVRGYQPRTDELCRRSIDVRFGAFAAAIRTRPWCAAPVMSAAPLVCQQLVPFCHERTLDLRLLTQTVHEIGAVVDGSRPSRAEDIQPCLRTRVRDA